MNTTLATRRGKYLKVGFHIIGLSCLAGAVFSSLFMFSKIIIDGTLIAVEHNQIILFSEFFFMMYASTYLIISGTNQIKSIVNSWRK